MDPAVKVVRLAMLARASEGEDTTPCRQRQLRHGDPSLLGLLVIAGLDVLATSTLGTGFVNPSDLIPPPPPPPPPASLPPPPPPGVPPLPAAPHRVSVCTF